MSKNYTGFWAHALAPGGNAAKDDWHHEREHPEDVPTPPNPDDTYGPDGTRNHD